MNYNYLDGKWYIILDDGFKNAILRYTESIGMHNDLSFDSPGCRYWAHDKTKSYIIWSCEEKPDRSEGFKELSYSEFINNVLNTKENYEIY